MFENNQIDQDLPNINQVNFTKIDKNYLKILLINFFISIIILNIILFIGFRLVNDQVLQELKPLAFIILNILAAIRLLFIIIGFSKRQYALRDLDISYKSGVLIQSMVTVPLSRIQHIEIGEGFLSRFFKITTLDIFTAGDSSEDLSIHGIKRVKAEKIKEFIINFINE
jgi:membrane protein YdbS with pleckstrin-like domain